MPTLICHEEIQKCKCGTELQEVPTTTTTRSRFKFAITHKRNGKPIKNLETEGPFLGVIELGWCTTCEDFFAILDSEDNTEVWSKLPDLHKPD